MVGWHHQLNGHGFEQVLGDSEGQGSLACCSPWGHKELGTTKQLNNKNKSLCMWVWCFRTAWDTVINSSPYPHQHALMLQYVSAAISVLCLNKNDFHRQTQLLYLFLFILLAPLGGSAIYHPRGKKIRQRDFNLFVQDRENPVISHVIAANSCVLPQGEQAASQDSSQPRKPLYCPYSFSFVCNSCLGSGGPRCRVKRWAVNTVGTGVKLPEMTNQVNGARKDKTGRSDLQGLLHFFSWRHSV